MAAVVSVGIHGWQFCSFYRAAARGRGTQVCREFCLLVSTRGARRAQLLACDAQQLAASSTALWQLA